LKKIAVHDALDRLVHGRVLYEHDVGGLAAQLEGHLLARWGAGDARSGFAEPRSEPVNYHLVDAGVLHQRPAGLPRTSVDDIDPRQCGSSCLLPPTISRL